MKYVGSVPSPEREGENMAVPHTDNDQNESRHAINRRDLLKGAGAAAGVAGIAVAGGTANSLISPSGASAQETAGGTLIEGFTRPIGLLAPIVDADRQTLFLFDTLVSTSAETLQPQPNLAASWEVSEDGLTYTFALAPHVTFHDGEPFTSADVKLTFDFLLNEATASPYYSLFSGRIASVETADPATVVVTLSAPSPTFLGDLSAYSIGILPQHLLAGVKPEELAASEFATTKPVGTGPFKLKEFRPGEALILEANPDYHRGAPKLEGHIIKILGDSTVAYQQLKTGEVDVAAISADFFEDASSQENFTPVVIDTFGITFLAFNQDATTGSAALQDLKVRQALFYAIDRQLIIDRILSGLGKVAVGTEPPATWAYQPDQITETFAFDAEKAAALLDEAGWVAGDGGIRAKDGVKLSFSALANSSTKTNEGVLLAIQELWAAIGVELTPALESDAYFDKLLAKEYQVALVSYTFAPDPDQSLAWSSTSPYNAWGYNNPRVDELLTNGLASSDIEERKAIYLEMQNILLADLPAAVLFFDQRVTGVNNRVKNYVPTAVGYYFAVHYDAPTWEIAGGS
jgi:peptide/nickel transport system substrate-binding protein